MEQLYKISIVFIVIFVVLFCSALLTVVCFDKNYTKIKNSVVRKTICSRCAIGKETCNLDQISEYCPYVTCWENGKCEFFKPIEKSSKTDEVKKNKA